MHTPDSTLLINEASVALKNIYGKRLSKIILFGSYARGEQKAESDIDLLVVLKDVQIDSGNEIRFMNNFFYPMSLKHSVDISAHPVTQNKFESGAGFFLKRVKKEGKEI